MSSPTLTNGDALQLPPTPASDGGCCGFLAIGRCLSDMCEPPAPGSEDEPPLLRLQRKKEAAERKRVEELAKAAEQAAAEERAMKEYQEEMEEVIRSRSTMTEEELELDCLKRFESLNYIDMPLVLENDPISNTSPYSHQASQDLSESTHRPPEEDIAVVEQAREEDEALAKQRMQPNGVFEEWLHECFISSEIASNTDDIRRTPSSFGELTDVTAATIVQPLAEALSGSARQAEEALATIVVESEPEENLKSALELLIEKFERADEPSNEGAVEDVADTDTHSVGTAAMHQQLAKRHRAVAQRLSVLLPCIEADVATSRLVAALATLDAATSDISIQESTSDQLSAPFRKPMSALATADVCWGMCSEKRHLVVEQLVPGVEADGRWSWPELRRFGIGWWLQSEGCNGVGPAADPLEVVIKKIGQSALAHLRRQSDPKFIRNSNEDSNDVQHYQDAQTQQNAIRRLVDEAFFWYVLMGTNIARLRALLKTGTFKGEPAIATLLGHPKSGEEEFMRKNAFRLLQLHRFHLAASLFSLAGCHEEAARVVASHLCDLQLALVLSRRHKEAVMPLLQAHLEGAPAAQDPWLRFLLAWHAGNLQIAQSCCLDATPPGLSSASSADDNLCGEQVSVALVFDGILRLSSCSEGLLEVGRHLLGSKLSK